jgi:hypothetical protein
MTDDIIQRLRAFDNGYVGTHYDDCWHYHPICAILRAADEIEQLRKELRRVALDHLATLSELEAVSMIARDFVDVDDEDYDG